MTPPPAPFLKVLRTSLPEVGVHPGALADLHAGRLDAIIVEGAMDPAHAARLVGRLEAELDPDAEIQLVPEAETYLQSPVLVGSSSWEQHLAAAEAWNDRAAGLCAGGPSLAAVFEASLGPLAGDLPVVVADHAGRPLMPETVRRMPPGGGLPRHLEIEQSLSPMYADFNPQLDGVTIWSFYITLQPALAGGELVVCETFPEERDPMTLLAGRVSAQTLDARRHVRLAFQPGDLVMFAGGRFFHSVSPVEGDQSRWTVGGFMARSADGARFLRWS
jgi:hypothetical protein